MPSVALAIVAQSIWSAILVMSGTLSQLVSYTGFAVVLFSAIAVLSLFVFRAREKTKRPFSTWGYPVAPAVFVIASAVMVGNEIWNNFQTSMAGLGVILAGIPVYLWFVRSKAKRVRPS